MNTATEADLFEYVANHLLTQNKQALNVDDECVYRSNNGMRCSIGCLINGDHYNNSLEGQSLQESDLREAVENSIDRKLTETEVLLLISLQGVHDEYTPSEWPAQIDELREKRITGEWQHSWEKS
jgi:hypothetical protein